MVTALLPVGFWMGISISITLALVIVVGVAWFRMRLRLQRHRAAQRAVWLRKRWIKEARFPKRPYRVFL
jgi:hypothetical protein